MGFFNSVGHRARSPLAHQNQNFPTPNLPKSAAETKSTSPIGSGFNTAWPERQLAERLARATVNGACTVTYLKDWISWLLDACAAVQYRIAWNSGKAIQPSFQ
jgi:hypothetical protein